MPGSKQVVAANLGPEVAALVLEIDGQPAAVINSEAAHNKKLRRQAAWALLCVGLDAGLILGALHGIRR
jgi:hypothetical protein